MHKPIISDKTLAEVAAHGERQRQEARHDEAKEELVHWMERYGHSYSDIHMTTLAIERLVDDIIARRIPHIRFDVEDDEH